MNHETTVTYEWRGYRIAADPTDPTGERLTVTKAGINVMPAACHFTAVEDAKRGIACLRLAKATGGDFWDFMEIAG